MEQLFGWQQDILDNPLYFGLFFIGGWLVVSFMFSIVTGWNKLAERYRTYNKPDFKLFRAVQVTWGSPLMAGNIYIMGSSNKGLYLGVLFPFRIGHPPLLIPWRDLRVEKVKSFMSNKVVFKFKDGTARPLEIKENMAEKLIEGSGGQLSF